MVETSQAGVVPEAAAGAAGQVVPVHLGRQHSWVESGKWTGVSPEVPQPEPLLPGLAQWPPPAGGGGPGGAGPGGAGGAGGPGGGAGPPHA